MQYWNVTAYDPFSWARNSKILKVNIYLFLLEIFIREKISTYLSVVDRFNHYSPGKVELSIPVVLSCVQSEKVFNSCPIRIFQYECYFVIGNILAVF